MRVLLVCSGNICRSPMAAEYLRHRAARCGLLLSVESRGLLGIEGEPASREAVEALREHGIDLSEHRSRGLARDDLLHADLVLVMTGSHLEEIERRFAGAARRVLPLRAFEDGPDGRAGAPDLEDPIGGPLPEYRECFRMIRSCVDHLLDALGARR